MQEEIIKTALLGTDKYQLRLSEELENWDKTFSSNNADKEGSFLKNAAVSFLYEECGKIPLILTAEPDVCPAEVSSKLNSETNSQLKAALIAKDEVLFDYLINRCNFFEKVVSPDLAPLLLNKALEQKRKAKELVKVCGETGKWLCGLNKNWNNLLSETIVEVDWELGSLDSRLTYFMQLRNTEPTKALILLDGTFEQENANTRAEFLSLFTINLSAADIPFLEKAQKDKSKKVKEMAMQFLQRIPGSSINQIYFNYLSTVLSIKEERIMLISKKKILQINQSVTPSEELFLLGIEKISSEKGAEDHVFWVAQMLQFVPIAALASQLQVKTEELIKLFLEHKQFKTLGQFLIKSAINFEDKLVAVIILDSYTSSDVALVKLLDVADRVSYYEQFVSENLLAVLDALLTEDYSILPMTLAEKIIKKLSSEPYKITQPTYQRLGLQLPSALSTLLDGYANDIGEDYQKRYFNNQAANMLHYIELRNTLHI